MSEDKQLSKLREVLTAAAFIERTLMAKTFAGLDDLLSAVGQFSLMYAEVDEDSALKIREVIGRTKGYQPVHSTFKDEPHIRNAFFKPGQTYYAIPLHGGSLYRIEYINGKAAKCVNVSGTKIPTVAPELFESGHFAIPTFSARLDEAVYCEDSMYTEMSYVFNEKLVTGDGTSPGRALFYRLSQLNAIIRKDEEGNDELYFGSYSWMEWLSLILFGQDPNNLRPRYKDAVFSVLAHAEINMSALFHQKSYNSATFRNGKGMMEDSPYSTSFRGDGLLALDISKRVVKLKVTPEMSDGDAMAEILGEFEKHEGPMYAGVHLINHIREHATYSTGIEELTVYF